MKVKPCPKCKSTDIVVNPDCCQPNADYYIWCNICKYKEKWYNTKEEAIKNWNTRT